MMGGSYEMSSMTFFYNYYEHSVKPSRQPHLQNITIARHRYRLTQFDRVVHMDADTFLLNPIDELFQEADDGNSNRDSLIYTTDPNMASHRGEDCMPAQGGFLVLKPHEGDFRGIIRTLMTTEFFQGGAWNGSKIGWFWGGMTVRDFRCCSSIASMVIET